MQITYDLLRQHNDIVVWGTGRIMNQYIGRIDPELKIVGFCDTYSKNWGKKLARGLLCFPKEELTEKNTVIIAIENPKDIAKVSEELNEKGIDYCHILDAVEGFRAEWEKREIARYEKSWGKTAEPEDDFKIKKYISCHIPYSCCNFRCSYCYVRQLTDFDNEMIHFASPEYIQKAFSRKRIGGTALLNFCARGETLLHPEVVPIICKLVEEGHYVSVVTNGTISAAFQRFIDMKVNLKKFFFKFSFHYLELKKKHLLETFFDNVNLMRKCGASFTVEVVASDDVVPYIEEIKESCLQHVGALPQLTLPRDDRTKEIDLLVKENTEEYQDIWSDFDSELFRFKLEILHVKRNEYCHAGDWSLQVDLKTGKVYQCVGHPEIFNIYDDICKPLKAEPVGENCRLPYCYNGHVYLTLGDIEGVTSPTYCEVRDRQTADGGHWFTSEMQDVFSQRLYKNN